MMSAKMAIKVITSYILSMTSATKFLPHYSIYVIDVVMWPRFCSSSICIREVIIASILKGFDQKNAFLEGWSWFKINNVGLALGKNLKFYTSLPKWLKLKLRKFGGLFPKFVEVTGEKLLGVRLFAPVPAPRSWIELIICHLL